MIGNVFAKALGVAAEIFSREIEGNRGAQAAMIVAALFGVAAWLVRRAKV